MQRALLLTAAFSGVCSAYGQTGPFVEAPDGPLTVTPPAHAINVEPVGVDVEMLRALEDFDVFEIVLYGDPLVAIVDRIRPQAEGFTIKGHFDRSLSSFFSITVVGDAVAGTFHIPGARDMVRLRYGGPGGLHYLHEVQTGPNDACAGEPPVMFRPGDGPAQVRDVEETDLDDILLDGDRSGGGDASPIQGGCFPTDTTFDVMIVYSDDARLAAGGTNAIRAEAINAVEIMSNTYGTCYVIIRTNTVYLNEASYNESGSYEDHLNRLTDPGDGILDWVHGTRDDVDADFVSLFVNDSESGGLGWCYADEDEAFCVVRWDLAADNFTLPHETGHNIGCAHNPEDADCEPTNIGYGHFFYVPSEDAWRHTVMSYSNNGSTRIPYYSHPDCEYEGEPTGTSTRQNLSVILDRKGTCENFRLTRMDVFVDFAHRGTENGSWIFPYDTVSEGVSRVLSNPPADLPTLHIKAGSTTGTITITKPMVIEACGGTVTIGGQ